MDEPVTYLDLEGKRTFFSMVNKLKKSGKTIILVLHDLSDAIRISDNLVIMNDRKIAISDTPANCLKAPKFLDDFCIYVFHFLLDFIREITEEVDAGFVLGVQSFRFDGFAAPRYGSFVGRRV